MTPSLEAIVDYATRCARFVVLVDPATLERALDELEQGHALGAEVDQAKAIVQATLDYRRAIEQADARPPAVPDEGDVCTCQHAAGQRVATSPQCPVHGNDRPTETIA